MNVLSFLMQSTVMWKCDFCLLLSFIKCNGKANKVFKDHREDKNTKYTNACHYQSVENKCWRENLKGSMEKKGNCLWKNRTRMRLTSQQSRREAWAGRDLVSGSLVNTQDLV